MSPQTRNLVAYANFFVAACIGVWSIYLISMPLHPPSTDSHGGLLAAFSGMFLMPVGLAAFAAGRLIQQQSRAAWLVQLVALALVVTLVLLLVL